MVSVILPVYNGATFLENTLEQVLNQKYTDFELIIIDDGSTDDSASICEKYCRSDKRIQFFRQDNKGISSTRNRAIELARGEYISFVDQDDEIDIALLWNLVDLIENSSAEISKVAYKIIDIDETGKIEKEKIAKSSNTLFNSDSIGNSFSVIRDQMQSVWNCLYSKKLLVRSGIKFDERMKYGGEDIAFNLSLLPHVNQIASSDYLGYFHYKRVSTSTSAKLNYNRVDSIVMINQLEKDIIPKCVTSDKVKYVVNSEILANLCLVISIICQNKHIGIGEKKKYFNRIKKDGSLDFSIIDFKFLYYLFKNYKFRLLAGMLYKFNCISVLVNMANIRMGKTF